MNSLCVMAITSTSTRCDPFLFSTLKREQRPFNLYTSLGNIEQYKIMQKIERVHSSTMLTRVPKLNFGQILTEQISSFLDGICA